MNEQTEESLDPLLAPLVVALPVRGLKTVVVAFLLQSFAQAVGRHERRKRDAAVGILRLHRAQILLREGHLLGHADAVALAGGHEGRLLLQRQIHHRRVVVGYASRLLHAPTGGTAHEQLAEVLEGELPLPVHHAAHRLQHQRHAAHAQRQPRHPLVLRLAHAEALRVAHRVAAAAPRDRVRADQRVCGVSHLRVMRCPQTDREVEVAAGLGRVQQRLPPAVAGVVQQVVRGAVGAALRHLTARQGLEATREGRAAQRRGSVDGPLGCVGRFAHTQTEAGQVAGHVAGVVARVPATANRVTAKRASGPSGEPARWSSLASPVAADRFLR